MQDFIWIVQNLRLIDVVDIGIVSLLFFLASFLFRGTQAVTLLRGMLVLVVGLVIIAGILRLEALSWLLANTLTVFAVALPVIFQPELRRALEQIGRGSALFRSTAPDDLRLIVIDEVCAAVEKLSERRHGALIVLERKSNLEEYISTGVRVDSDVKRELLLTIFWPKTELHDGAVIVNRNGRMASAAAVLPLTASRNLPNPKMGTRHRASLGISESSDAICVVVSEETGKIAITNAGRMIPRLDLERLRNILLAFYGPTAEENKPIIRRVRERLQEWISTQRNTSKQGQI